jgi:hypothetical protein
MSDGVEIKGGAGIFEAAVIAVVLDHIDAEEKAKQMSRGPSGNRLSSWVRALTNTGEIALPPATPR